MSITENFVIEQGEDFYTVIEIFDAYGQSVNMEGMSVAGGMIHSYYADPADKIPLVCEIISPAATSGEIKLSLPYSTTKGLVSRYRYVFDVFIWETGTEPEDWDSDEDGPWVDPRVGATKVADGVITVNPRAS